MGSVLACLVRETRTRASDPDTANSFAWQNMSFYFRRVLPVMALNSLDDRIFSLLSNPTWEFLIAVLIIDYIALLITTRFKKSNEKIR